MISDMHDGLPLLPRISEIGLGAIGASSKVDVSTDVVYIPFIEALKSCIEIFPFALPLLIRQPAPCGAEKLKSSLPFPMQIREPSP